MNDFDELIGADVQGAERERLRAVHELLLEAGSPPELSAALANAPRPGSVHFLGRQSVPRKLALLAATIAVLGATFSLGFATGNRSAAAPKTVESLTLKGTGAAPNAQATLDVWQSVGGNWPMTLHVSGLPRATAPTYYVVWLVRGGQTVAPCGQFVVAKSGSSLTLKLTAPYALKRGDTWVVTRQRYSQPSSGSGMPGRGYRPQGRSSVVLRPI